MTSSAYQDLLKTQKEILELGMYCKNSTLQKPNYRILHQKTIRRGERRT